MECRGSEMEFLSAGHPGVEAWRGLWGELVSSAALVACAALRDVRQEHDALAAPPNSTFEVSTGLYS
jgi:hypothetical protein